MDIRLAIAYKDVSSGEVVTRQTDFIDVEIALGRVRAVLSDAQDDKISLISVAIVPIVRSQEKKDRYDLADLK